MFRYFRNYMVAICLIAAAAAVTLTPQQAAAQILYGSITGTVTDQQKAALPGVTVTAINTGTNLATEAVTDAAGNFTIRNLIPGIYDLTAVLQGFREMRQRGLNITANNIRRMDLMLQLGQLSETVNVVAESTLLQTEKADLNTDLSAKAITNMPLNQYRNYQSLLNLVPGATPTQFQNAEIDTPARSLRTWVNGTQPNANTTRVDGAVSVNVWLPHHAMYIQSAESIDTVNIATNNFDADTGMAAGASQTVITKSGTNQLRGSAFLFWNKDSFNSNTYYNDYFDLPKPGVDTKTFGGTVGGPILKNKLFYFFSWERYDTKRPITYTYTVPTAKMRAGDFSEVAAVIPTFKLFNPYTGTNGVGREQWTNNIVPAQYIGSIAQNIMKYYPAVNSTKDLNSNLLLDDYSQLRNESQLRDNIDVKINWQIKPTATIWGKLGYMKNKGTGSGEYLLGFDTPANGNTRVILTTFGTTWTLGPSTVLDGNFGMSRQDQDVLPPDYGTNYGLQLGIPGVNNPNDIRESGLPTFANGYNIGTAAPWWPTFRKETSYSGTLALTKVFAKHEMRAGFDFVRLELNHRQAEFGDYGLKGGFSFSGNVTGASGYVPQQWNQFAAFLMGIPNYYSEDTQTEDMTGRDNQFAWYVRDRWNVSPKLTVSAGVRLGYYPLMQRVGRGIETLNYSTMVVTLGGIGGQPNDAGVSIQTWYLEPRLGVAYRLNENNVLRAGYGITRNPLPWTRPMRGSFPFDINNNATAPGTFDWVTTLDKGIPAVQMPPGMDTGKVVLPRGVYFRSPNMGTEAFPGSGSGVDRGRIQQWNVSFERRLPKDIAVQVAYVGTATDGGYADLNYNVGVPGGGGTAAKYYASAGTSAINDWAARTKSRYKGLQVSANRPFKNGLMLKGAYTWSQSKNMTSNDEDGWSGLTWNYGPMYDQNFAIAGFDRTHVFSLGWVYELPWLKGRNDAVGAILGGWQVNGVWSWFTGAPFNIGGSNNALACTGCGSIRINYSGSEPKTTGDPGQFTQPYYDKSLFSQPTGLDVAGFGNTERSFFRMPSQWNVDLSLFKAFPFGRYRGEFRMDWANIFNHVNWGAPNTTFTSPNFLLYSPSNTNAGNTPGPRRLTLGFRFQF